MQAQQRGVPQDSRCTFALVEKDNLAPQMRAHTSGIGFKQFRQVTTAGSRAVTNTIQAAFRILETELKPFIVSYLTIIHAN
jgi:hypothetical protein